MIWLTILSIIRSLFAAIDRIIAWGIENVYVLIVQLANVHIFSGDVIETFANRINVLLGVIMLFWLAFRIIKYVIDPDLANDNKQGFGKIIMNVVVMLFMLVFVNYGFKAAYSVQNMIFDSNILTNLIFGTSNTEYTGKDEDSTRLNGKKIAFYIFSGFVYPSYGDNAYMGNNCKNFLNLDDESLSVCVETMSGMTTENLATKVYGGMKDYDIEQYMAGDVITARESDEFMMNYTFIISTVCGVVALLVLVQIAIDVAIRVAKLGLLQLIAPIPIISYIDPMSGKNGIFSKWLKEVGRAFASVFIRLLALYFSIFIIMMAISSQAYMGTDVAGIAKNEAITIGNHPLLTIMIILGALLFAKELPGLISKIFGINLDGKGFSLNPMQRAANAPIVGKGLAALGGAGAGFAGGLRSGHAIRGAFSGMRAGARTTSWTGNEAKSVHGPLGRGAHSAYKHVTGNDLSHFNAAKMFGHSAAGKEMDELKKTRNNITAQRNAMDISYGAKLSELSANENKHAELKNRYASQYDAHEKARSNYMNAKINGASREELAKYQADVDEKRTALNATQTELSAVESAISANKAEAVSMKTNLDSMDRDLSKINDQIKDVKQYYSFDESPKKDVAKIKDKYNK